MLVRVTPKTRDVGIEAMQFTVESVPTLMAWLGNNHASSLDLADPREWAITVVGLYAPVQAKIGNWFVKHSNGRFSVYHAEQFHDEYEITGRAAKAS